MQLHLEAAKDFHFRYSFSSDYADPLYSDGAGVCGQNYQHANLVTVNASNCVGSSGAAAKCATIHLFVSEQTVPRDLPRLSDYSTDEPYWMFFHGAICYADGDVELTPSPDQDAFYQGIPFGPTPNVVATIFVPGLREPNNQRGPSFSAAAQNAARKALASVVFPDQGQDIQRLLISNIKSVEASGARRGLRASPSPGAESGLSFEVTIYLEEHQELDRVKENLDKAAATAVRQALVDRLRGAWNGSSVTVKSKRNSVASAQVGAGEACSAHWMCEQRSVAAGGNDFCHADSTCQSCFTCITDTRDSVDSKCPQDRCPNSGGFPECLDGEKLLKEHLQSCKTTHAFEIWKYGKKEDGPPSIAPVKLSDTSVCGFM